MSSARIAGGIVALLMLVSLAWLAFASMGPEALVEPTVSIEATGSPGAASGVVAADALRDRSRLLYDRTQSETVDGVNVATGGAPQADLTARQGVARSREIVEKWRAPGDVTAILRKPDMIRGTSSLPYENADILEQPEGRDWRRERNGAVAYGGGWLILGVLLALALFLFARGRIRIAEGPAGTTVERFDAAERANHWMTATAFVLLALTGLVILYGTPLLLPVIGPEAMGTLAQVSAWTHMASMVPFIVGVCIMIALWVRDNVPTRLDWNWLKAGGGFASEDSPNPPARRFNAGQKIVFWGVVIGGVSAFASGLILMFPFALFGYVGMQWAQLVHAAIGLLMIALIIGHIYIGTVGMQGAIDAMWSGQVDENWAKEHHSIWYDRITDGSRSTKRLSNSKSSRPSPAAGE
ncbi:MAG: hypothetical protein APF80_13635 [Alphaproteobacteria bacterium BRH_c36]|nr:MAG: hypothetical protein APF80_13635 [Alphaproteobacteria bacterium BRH_c36]